jgi:hypothetical protein
MKLKEGRIYRAKTLNKYGRPSGFLREGWIWVYEGKVPYYDNHSFKSVASGKTFYTGNPREWFEDAEDEDR